VGFSLAPEIASVNAYSFKMDGLPYVVLKTAKTGERRTVDAVHELGHLIAPPRPTPLGVLHASR